MAAERGRRGARLLIVDDEVQILAALHRTLRREGYQIATAETAADALRQLRAGSFELVLSDHKMPGMSGLELLTRVGKLQPGAAKLLITGWPGAVSPDELVAAGVAAVLPKPWGDAELKRSLREALGNRQTPASVPAWNTL